MKFLVNEVVHPLALRAGSTVAVALVGLGMAAEHKVTVAQAVTVLVLFGVDLVARKMWPAK